MEPKQHIQAEKITKPIQLLAAWLIGLILIDGSFLVAAKSIEQPAWISGALVIASIVNVPIFLISIFLLQTRYRPEMQEDSFYSQYLATKTGLIITGNQNASLDASVHITSSPEVAIPHNITEENDNTQDSNISWDSYRIRVNKYLSESNKIKLSLLKKNIPIYDLFGNKDLALPDPPIVLIGSGFTNKHIKSILDSLVDFHIKNIAFAEAEGEFARYENIVLIGSYSSEHGGLSLSDAIELLDSNISIESFYSALRS